MTAPIDSTSAGSRHPDHADHCAVQHEGNVHPRLHARGIIGGLDDNRSAFTDGQHSAVVHRPDPGGVDGTDDSSRVIHHVDAVRQARSDLIDHPLSQCPGQRMRLGVTLTADARTRLCRHLIPEAGHG
jgi:hypothetical protein